MEYRVLDGESGFRNSTGETEMVYYLQSWSRYRVTWGDQGRVQGERGRTPGHMALLVLWGSRAKARLVNTTKRSEVLVCYVDLLSGGAQREGRGRFDHKGENPMKNVGLLVTTGYCVRRALA